MKVSGRQQRYFLRGEWKESPGGHRPVLLFFFYHLGLHEAMEVQVPIAGALGVVAVTPQELRGRESVQDIGSLFSVGCLHWLFYLIEFFFPRGLPFAIVS